MLSPFNMLIMKKNFIEYIFGHWTMLYMGMDIEYGLRRYGRTFISCIKSFLLIVILLIVNKKIEEHSQFMKHKKVITKCSD